jgi:hypothetical protein
VFERNSTRSCALELERKNAKKKSVRKTADGHSRGMKDIHERMKKKGKILLPLLLLLVAATLVTSEQEKDERAKGKRAGCALDRGATSSRRVDPRHAMRRIEVRKRSSRRGRADKRGKGIYMTCSSGKTTVLYLLAEVFHHILLSSLFYYKMLEYCE